MNRLIQQEPKRLNLILTARKDMHHFPEGSELLPEKFIEMMKSSIRWSTLSVTFREISESLSDLVGDMSGFDRRDTTKLISSFLTVPEYQANVLRIEVLVALAIMHCSGNKKATIADASRWFEEIGKSRCAIGEDPSEDVFVTNVHYGDADYLLLEGLWESSGFNTQRILDLASSFPDSGKFLGVVV